MRKRIYVNFPVYKPHFIASHLSCDRNKKMTSSLEIN